MRIFQSSFLVYSWYIGALFEVYVAFLAFRTIRNTYPWFTRYLVYSAVKDISLAVISATGEHFSYFCLYYALSIPLSAVQWAVLLEVFAVFFKPYRVLTPKYRAGVLGLFFAAIALICLIPYSTPRTDYLQWHLWLYRHIDRILCCVTVVGFAPLLCTTSRYSVPWRSRLQGIVAGLFLTSFASLITSSALARSGARGELLAIINVFTQVASLTIYAHFIKKPEELRLSLRPEDLLNVRNLLATFAKSLRAAGIACSNGDEEKAA